MGKVRRIPGISHRYKSLRLGLILRVRVRFTSRYGSEPQQNGLGRENFFPMAKVRKMPWDTQVNKPFKLGFTLRVRVANLELNTGYTGVTPMRIPHFSHGPSHKNALNN